MRDIHTVRDQQSDYFISNISVSILAALVENNATLPQGVGGGENDLET